MRDHRQVVEGILYRYRCGLAWRDLPASFAGICPASTRPPRPVTPRGRRARGVSMRLLVRSPRSSRSPQGAGSNHKDSAIRAGQGAPEVRLGLYDEPVDHGIGRSRGGLSTKIHHLVDGRGRPLVILVGPGQSNDSPMFPVLLDHLRVERPGPGRPRTTPDALMGDKAYSARAHRTLLRSRGIKAVIPEPSSQIRHTATTRLPRRTTTSLRRRPLGGPQRRRTVLQHHQAVARPGHPLRQARDRLPRRGRPERDHHLA